MSDKHSKTESPTPKRLRDAKKKGQVVKSQELSPAISLLAFAFLGLPMSKLLLHNGMNLMRRAFTEDFSSTMTFSLSRVMIARRILEFMIIILPYLGAAVLLGIVVNMAQVGFNFTKDPIKPDFKRLNPIEGFKNIFSKKAVFTFAKNLAKLVLVFYLAYTALSESASEILSTGDIGIEKVFFFLLYFVKDLVIKIGIVMLGLAVIDYVFQRKEHHDNLKMTMQEVIDESKEMEGNPEVKQARRQRQREISMGRMMESIPEADVILTNPTHLSIAIRYDSEKDNAPVVLAKGADFLAMKIREEAKEHNVPIIENKALARKIYKEAEVGDYIPIELYQAVAEILALVYKIKEERKNKI